MTSSREDGIVKSVNQMAALVANRDPFSSVESIVKTKVVGAVSYQHLTMPTIDVK